MTVLSTVSRVSYATDGVTTGPFTVPFYFIANSDLVVQKTFGGVTSNLVLNTDYTVSGAGSPSGGSVTTIGALAAGTIIIYRDPAIIQDAAYGDHGRFPAASHEKALDRGTMIDQRLAERIDDILTALSVAPATAQLTKGGLMAAVSGILPGGIFAFRSWLSAADDDAYRLTVENATYASSIQPALLAYMQASSSAHPPGLGLSLSAAQAQLATLLTNALTQPQ